MLDPDHNDDAKNAHRQHRPDKPLSAPAPSAFWRKHLFEGESIQLPRVKVGPFLGKFRARARHNRPPAPIRNPVAPRGHRSGSSRSPRLEGLKHARISQPTRNFKARHTRRSCTSLVTRWLPY